MAVSQGTDSQPAIFLLKLKHKGSTSQRITVDFSVRGRNVGSFVKTAVMQPGCHSLRVAPGLAEDDDGTETESAVLVRLRWCAPSTVFVCRPGKPEPPVERGTAHHRRKTLRHCTRPRRTWATTGARWAGRTRRLGRSSAFFRVASTGSASWRANRS
ncbi:MAG: hypothetical protein R2873_15995 [Caldilineaceae bacterium]